MINKSNTVESWLFMEGQCKWILWVTLTHKFTSPQSYDKVMNQEHFDNPQTLTTPLPPKMIPQ